MQKQPIGIFDSGIGGLTILKEIKNKLPQYDYLYLGDNARAPFGNRSFETVYNYTLESISWLFKQHCPLIIVACNTASAKALRTIQQNDLIGFGENKKVLGVIRPTTEIIGNFSTTKHIGILGTTGTVLSNSYLIEIAHFFPEIKIFQEACPLWVPLIEQNEIDNKGANYFIQKYVQNLLKKSSLIDTVLLACTHYPIIYNQIKSFLPAHIQLIQQGEIVANSLETYLDKHIEIKNKISTNQDRQFYTTDEPDKFKEIIARFYDEKIQFKHIKL